MRGWEGIAYGCLVPIWDDEKVLEVDSDNCKKYI
jgi:hypothetical protein